MRPSHQSVFAFSAQPKNIFQRIENFSVAFATIRNKFKHDCTENIMRMVSGDETEIAKFASTLQQVWAVKNKPKVNRLDPVYFRKNSERTTTHSSGSTVIMKKSTKQDVVQVNEIDSIKKESIKENSGSSISNEEGKEDKFTGDEEIIIGEIKRKMNRLRRASDPREMQVVADVDVNGRKFRKTICFGKIKNEQVEEIPECIESSGTTTTEGISSEENESESLSGRDQSTERFSSSEIKVEEKKLRPSLQGKLHRRKTTRFSAEFGKELQEALLRQQNEHELRVFNEDQFKNVLKELHEKRKKKEETVLLKKCGENQAIAVRMKPNGKNTSPKKEVPPLCLNSMIQTISYNRELPLRRRTQRRQSCALAIDEVHEIQKVVGVEKNWNEKKYTEQDITQIKEIQWLIRNREAHKNGIKIIKRMKERKGAVLELIKNERYFLENMEVLKESFEVLKNNGGGSIFVLAQEYMKRVVEVTEELKNKLEEIIYKKKEVYGNGIAQCFIGEFGKFEEYAHFINLYKRIMNDYEEVMKKQSEKMPIYEYMLELKIKKQTDLDSLSSMPFQHIMRYKIQLNRIMETLPKYDSRMKEYEQANQIVGDVICNVNNQYKSFAQSTELNEIIGRLSIKIDKTLFGRTVLSIENGNIIKVKSKDIFKGRYKGKTKKCVILIISDAILFIVNKSLTDLSKIHFSDISEKKKVLVENIFYFDNLVLMPFSSHELHIYNNKEDYLIKFSNTMEMTHFINKIEEMITNLWIRYSSVLKSIKADKYSFFSTEVEDTSFHSDALLDKSTVIHIVLAGVYLFLYKSTLDFIEKKKPLHTFNLFETKVLIQCNELGETVFITFCVNDKDIKVQLQSLPLGMLWINCMRNEMQSYLYANRNCLPLLPNLPIGINPWYIWQIIPNINENDKCFICGKFSSIVDVHTGKFYCTECGKKKRNASLIETSRTELSVLASITKDSRQLLAHGNNILKALIQDD
ncbi:hypothetical protein EDI_199040 [Entamoeba dispar SAW760]|uniref:DH domain-containing protein n=1 Tax=Entamoeba dispar (strain ATCC PRA-260 / SAW760) TaxID=370354 RepID=B0EMZ0_ENTDS|nr:uncharacterized protein EDI_199040 [Entamoeba dispar SAW760]EDR24114.1 hypothetical protein EDI_199040 [Entamoeba dispar SAW760]|eukprot:EDR24114.1 hypothetical protein EDI_199040 [Entamoeba dispar SAW760]